MPVERLHRVLLIGQIALAAVFLFLHFRGIVPLQGSDNARLIAYALSGISVLQVVVAFFVLKQRVPTRSPAQSAEQYWSTPAKEKALLVWFILEGACVISLVGFFLTGEPVSTIVASVAILVFIWSAPSAFAQT